MTQDGRNDPPGSGGFKTVGASQNAKFAAVADEVRREVATNLVARLQACTEAWERDAVISGLLAGAGQVVWTARPNGGTLERALEFWHFAGETHIKQFYAEDQMGPTQGGRQ